LPGAGREVSPCPAVFGQIPSMQMPGDISKWAIITKTSQDTASRDINDLVACNILRKDEAGGRSISYSLAEEAAIQGFL